MKLKILSVISVILLIFTLTGCASEVKRYAVITSKSLEIDARCSYYFVFGGSYYRFLGKINEFEVGDTLWLKK